MGVPDDFDTLPPTASPEPSVEMPDEQQARIAAGVQAAYEATIADFPYELAPGFEFPGEVPLQDPHIPASDGSGSEIAFGVWRCGLIEAAAYETDRDVRLDLLLQTTQATDEQLPGNEAWSEGAALAVDDPNTLGAEMTVCENKYG